MNTQIKITNIIAKRQPLTQKIQTTETNLISLKTAIQNLENLRYHLIQKTENPDITAHLQQINIPHIQLTITQQLETLRKLKTRFSRPTLNIGVVGRARQGKSRLLQSLTGLTAAEIPDGSAQHCTGVRSTIYHHPTAETFGEVWFHTERSFLEEIIAPYYDRLSLTTKPITLNEFANNPLPPLPKNTSGAEVGAKYEHLRRYHTYINKYGHFLQTASPRQISKNEIREYVAQDNLQGERIYYNYLAVREVKITCNFPNQDVGQIALVDLPGLGDTGIGDEERLIKTLGEDIDLVVFVRMPKASGDFLADVDVRLYDTARSALVEIPLEKWSFMVLNCTDSNSNFGDNSLLCQQLAADLTNKYINVSEWAIANCADPEAANTKILDRALNYLADNITNLDQTYATSCQKSLNQLHETINTELNKAKNALGLAKQPAETAQFEILFEQLWQQLTSGLEKLLRNLSQQIDEHDRDFKAAVQAAIQVCKDDSAIPTSLAEINIRRDSFGGYGSAYEQYLNEIRAHLSQKFLSLDDGLKRSLNRVKSLVAEVLISRLGGLTEVSGAEFLEAIALLLPDELLPHQPSKLKYGFHILSEFVLSYRGFIQHRIRKCLNGLTPDKTTLKLSTSPTAEEVMTNLKTLHAEAVYECENALEDLLTEPSQAGFAIVEEFLDRVLRAEGVKIEWRIFLNQERSNIWPDEFELLGERTRLRQEWLTALDAVATTNQLERLSIIHNQEY
ncbi:MAG: hypothetical protein WBA93_01250 [Microcoleaceae cyanobacterium]